jgi:hypothetical protein
MVYYNYGLSQDWPQFNADDPTKAGGRCVVAPFFYRYDHPVMAPDAPYKLPQFFDNTLISADWFRSIISECLFWFFTYLMIPRDCSHQRSTHSWLPTRRKNCRNTSTTV